MLTYLLNQVYIEAYREQNAHPNKFTYGASSGEDVEDGRPELSAVEV